jgi:flagellar motor switch protein FliG
MADAPGEDVVLMLLRALPSDVAGSILGRLGGEAADRLRKRLTTASIMPAANNELDQALSQFFDLQRIAERTPATGEYRPVSAPAPTSPAATSSPVDDLKTLPPDRLARALDGEQVGTIALILSCLEPAAAGQVMKRMPVDSRAEIAVRITKLGTRNQVLLQQLARAVTEKGRRLGDVPPEPNQEEIIVNLADMLRALPRAERFPVIRKIEAVDAELAAKVLEKLSRIEDLLKIPDRQLQGLLAKLDVKTIAIALKNVNPAIRSKVTSNMSSRSRTVLDEESELLGDVVSSRVQEAQAKVLTLIRKGEEDGEIVMEE